MGLDWTGRDVLHHGSVPMPPAPMHVQVRDRAECLDRHLADSLALLPIIDHHWQASRGKGAAAHPAPSRLWLKENAQVATGWG